MSMDYIGICSYVALIGTGREEQDGGYAESMIAKTSGLTPAAGDATLRFSPITNVTAMVETMPLERAAEAYARMMAGRYVPYGKNGVMPIRGGLEQIWRSFPQAVPDFAAEIVEMIQAEENTSTRISGSLGLSLRPPDVAACTKKRFSHVRPGNAACQ